MKIIQLQHDYGGSDKVFYLGFCPYQGKFVLLEDQMMAMRFADGEYASTVLLCITDAISEQFSGRIFSVQYVDPEDLTGEPVYF